MTPPADSLSKADLHLLADQLLTESPEGIEACIEFFESDTKGLWHNRARAMIARRLKHCELTQSQRRRVVECILGRLIQGASSEQFRDQLRLGLHLDASRFFGAATVLQGDGRTYVQQLATWILEHPAPHV